MVKLLIAILLISLFSGCQDDEASEDPTMSIGIISKLYGVGFNRSVSIAWEISSPTIDFVGIYRHETANFTYNSSERIGNVSASSVAAFTDTGLVNGTSYYYTLVPEKKQPDGSILKGKGTKTIGLEPANFASIPTEQIRYSIHIDPLFKNGCAIAGCHAEEIHHGTFQKQLHEGSEYLLISWENVVTGSGDTPQLVAYRSTKSHMLYHLNSDTLLMPTALPTMPPRIQFPKDVLTFLQRWIDHGAANDNGDIPYAAIDPLGRVYVINQGEDLVAAIDVRSQQVVRFITAGVNDTRKQPPHNPHNVFVDYKNEFFYVTLSASNKLYKYRVSDNQKVGELTSGLSSPAHVIVNPTNDTAFVSNFLGTNSVTLIDTKTMAIIGSVTDLSIRMPHGLRRTPDGSTIIVANYLSDFISLIRLSDLQVESIPLSATASLLNPTTQFQVWQIAISNDGRFIYAPCYLTNELRIIDRDSAKVIKILPMPSGPLVPEITPDGQYVLISNRKNNSVSILQTSDNSIIATINNVGPQPHGIGITKDSKIAFIACENTSDPEPPHHVTVGGQKIGFVSVVDIQRRSVIKKLEVGNYATGVAVTH